MVHDGQMLSQVERVVEFLMALLAMCAAQVLIPLFLCVLVAEMLEQLIVFVAKHGPAMPARVRISMRCIVLHVHHYIFRKSLVAAFAHILVFVGGIMGISSVQLFHQMVILISMVTFRRAMMGAIICGMAELVRRWDRSLPRMTIHSSYTSVSMWLRKIDGG
jgi:hypothetical protein